MKLRIRGNSVRLRLTRSEVARIGAGEPVTDSVRFGPDSELRYRLEARSVADCAAELGDATITVVIPAANAAEWAATDRVSIEAEQGLGPAGTLQILVEKDFECLEPRAGEDASDLFRNPAKAGT
jgi:hypothetical protein